MGPMELILVTVKVIANSKFMMLAMHYKLLLIPVRKQSTLFNTSSKILK